MKSISRLVILVSIVSACAAMKPVAFAQTAGSPAASRSTLTDQGWPREFAMGSTNITIYQPQIEQWQGTQFEARAAVSIADAQSKTTTFGVVWFAARTEIDKINRLVIMSDFRISRVSFPTASDKAGLYQEVIQTQVPKTAQVIALDRLVADLANTQTATENAGYQLNNEPPLIFFSTRASILILIDGNPVLGPVQDTSLKRVINTRVLILHDPSIGKFYLHLMDGWMESNAATGSWSVAQVTSTELERALKVCSSSKQVDLLDGSTIATADRKQSLRESEKAGSIPSIYASTSPAELLQTAGDPQVATIEGTQLAYVTNTENDIFVDASTGAHYILISGRWFRSLSMNGPWYYSPGNELPADFARIPAGHPKADVLASIPGTPQAKEALVANNIPQTASVPRNTTGVNIEFDGAPQLKPIENTSLQYVINTSTPVIAVSANSFYTVQNGVWFVASALTGPWTVAVSVPSVIYSIPPASPLHYITYVKVYGSTPEVVYVGYTPGYYGTVVSSTNVVVYGTGWYYPAYVGRYWYGSCLTYGYGAGFAWSTSAGWGVAFGIGYGWSSYYYPGAWYTGVSGYYAGTWGVAGASAAYGQWGNVAYTGSRAAWANPYTGNVGRAGAYSGVNTVTGTRVNGRGFTNTNVYTGTTVSGIGGTAYNPNTGRMAAGQAGAITNPYTGNSVAAGRGVSYNPQTGVISGGAGAVGYNASTGQTNAVGRGFTYNTKTDTGVAVGKNNVYAGKDGNVYRYNKSDGLQQHTNSGWSSVDRPAESRAFQNQQTARATGQQRWDNFRNSGVVGGSGSRPSGNGGFRGHGGPRRR